MMGKLNVKSDTREGGERELGWKKGGDDVFPFSVPFVEFPCQSPAAESQPRINFKGRLRNAEETTSFPGLFLHSQKTA